MTGARERTDSHVAREDRLAALWFAARGLLVVALVGGTILGLERAILTRPALLGPWVTDFPTDRVVELGTLGSQIVLIGDSVVPTTATSDQDTRPLPRMLESELDGLGVRAVFGAATGVELYLAWLRRLELVPLPPTMVIIEVNPRSFSAHWDRNPGWLFYEQAAMTEHPIFARLASVLEWEWERPTDAEYRDAPVTVLGQVVGTVSGLERHETGQDPPPEIARGRYLVRYASDYAQSRRMATLHELVDEASGCAFPVLIFITPIDVEAIRAHLTPEELVGVEQNLALLRGELARSRWPTVDATELVPSVDFDHPIGDPHEHLEAAGRLALARALGSAIESLGEFGAR